jgi:hypothetical protein
MLAATFESSFETAIAIVIHLGSGTVEYAAGPRLGNVCFQD